MKKTFYSNIIRYICLRKRNALNLCESLNPLHREGCNICVFSKDYYMLCERASSLRKLLK